MTLNIRSLEGASPISPSRRVGVSTTMGCSINSSVAGYCDQKKYFALVDIGRNDVAATNHSRWKTMFVDGTS